MTKWIHRDCWALWRRQAATQRKTLARRSLRRTQIQNLEFWAAHLPCPSRSLREVLKTWPARIVPQYISARHPRRRLSMWRTGIANHSRQQMPVNLDREALHRLRGSNADEGFWTLPTNCALGCPVRLSRIALYAVTFRSGDRQPPPQRGQEPIENQS